MTLPRRLGQHLFNAYVVVVFFLATGAFVSLSVSPDDISQGSSLFKLLWGVVYVISVIRLALRWRQVVAVLKSNPAWVFLIALIFASTLWSLNPSETFQNAVILLLAAGFAMDMSLTLTLRQQLRLDCFALLLVVGLSIFVEIFLPGFIPGVATIEGAGWHGVMGSKNELGRVACFAVATSLAYKYRPAWLSILCTGASIVLTLLTRSAGAVGYLALTIILFRMWSILKWKTMLRDVALVALLIGGCFTFYYASQNMAKVTGMMGKDPHLTGRVDLWQYALRSIKQRPMLGYGYSAFWDVNSQPARKIREAVNWDTAPHSHNGYIDFTLGLGFIGIFAYLTLHFISLKRGLTYFMQGPDSYRRWPLTCLVLLLMYQFTESSIIAGHTIFWIFFCNLVFSVPWQEEKLVLPSTLAAPSLAA